MPQPEHRSRSDPTWEVPPRPGALLPELTTVPQDQELIHLLRGAGVGTLVAVKAPDVQHLSQRTRNGSVTEVALALRDTGRAKAHVGGVTPL